MSLRNDPNYFPSPDVPTNGNYGSSFGKEQLYYNYLPRSADIDAANAAAGEKTYSSGKYVFNPATGQYTWVPASAATLAPTTPTTPVTTLESPAGGEKGAGNDGSGGFPGATNINGVSGPTTGLASFANSAAATLGNMGLRGISDAIARNVDPNYSHEGRTNQNAPNVDSQAALADAMANAVSGADAAGGDTSGGGNAAQGGENGGGQGDAGPQANGGMVGRYAQGGLGSLGGYSDGGRLLRGPGDGVSDSIPATIGRAKQPARLADGEFVVPARIVSELGNGSTEAGARKLYAMLARIQAGRKKSMGKNNVATNSRMDKNLPA